MTSDRTHDIEITGVLCQTFDLMNIGLLVVISLTDNLRIILAISVIATVIIYNTGINSYGRIRRRLDISMIRFIIGVHYHIARGDRCEQVLEMMLENEIVQMIYSETGNLSDRMLALEKRLESDVFSRFTMLMDQLEVFDSESLLYELERMVNDLMKENFDALTARYEKADEMYVIPMAMNLINMLMMLCYPFLTEWK
jgi:hypothetical protein